MRDRIDFTEVTVEALKITPEDKSTDVWVWDAQRSGLGVRMRVGKAGFTSKTFYAQYQYGGRDRRIPIGLTSEYSFQDAQNRAYEVRRDAADGKNPEVVKAERSTVDKSFAEVARLFVDERKSEIRSNTWRSYERYLIESDSAYFQKLFKLEFKSVTKLQIVDCLNAVAKRSKSTAADARSKLILLYKYAQQEGIVPEGHNPALYTKDPQPKSNEDVGHALSDDELVTVWKAAEHKGRRNDTDFGRIVRLGLLLGNRRQEIGGMKWSEIKDGVWHLPAERTKTNFAREIILPAAAREIIGERTAGEYVFGSDKTKGFNGWSNSKKKFDERLAGKVSFTLHDLRRTMRTGLSVVGVSEEIAEAAIGHVSEKLVRTYNKHEKTAERAAAMNLWADHIEKLVNPPRSPQLRLVA